MTTNRSSRRRKRAPAPSSVHPTANPTGGRLRPLSLTDAGRIISTSLDILATVGMAGLSQDLLVKVVAAGATVRTDGRVLFPRSMVEDVISDSAKKVTLPGFLSEHDIEIGCGRVHIGTGGAAVHVLDGKSLEFSPSQLKDLYELMRVAGACENIHYSLRPVVSRDMGDSWLLDLNTAFAAMKATAKPIGTAFTKANHVAPIVEMLETGTGVPLRQRPYCFAAICHVVPPLCFAEDACEVLERCVAMGMPVQLCAAPQAGATSPASLAGTLSQALAESLRSCTGQRPVARL